MGGTPPIRTGGDWLPYPQDINNMIDDMLALYGDDWLNFPPIEHWMNHDGSIVGYFIKLTPSGDAYETLVNNTWTQDMFSFNAWCASAYASISSISIVRLVTRSSLAQCFRVL